MNYYYVYILTNQRHTVFYVGFTNDPERRTREHKEKVYPGFTKKYNCSKLVYVEALSSLEEALAREKQVKRYPRDWKINLINSINPEWRDLYEDFVALK